MEFERREAVDIKKGQCFVDHLLLDHDDPGWYTIYTIFKTEREASEQVGKWLDESPDRVFRIRDYLGGVVWQTPPTQGSTNNE